MSRLLIYAALIAAVLWGVNLLDASRQRIGYDKAMAEWTAEKLAESEAKRQREKALTITNQEIDHAYQIEKTKRLAADRATAQRLREYQAAASAVSDHPAATCGADEPYRAIANQCAASLVVLDEYAAGVAAKARALQDYARSVCVTP